MISFTAVCIIAGSWRDFEDIQKNCTSRDMTFSLTSTYNRRKYKEKTAELAVAANIN